jgi:hypothetical protein
MADQLARMRQIVGSPAVWNANDLTLGDGELALERVNANTVRARIGDGVKKYSEAPYLSGPFDQAAADARYVQQALTVTIGGVPAANKWPRLSANGKLDPSLLGLPGVLHYKGVTDPALPPPPGAIAGDVWALSPAGIIDPAWGAPVAGRAASEGDLLVLGDAGQWALITGTFDLAGLVQEIDLAGPGGAGMVGTASGDTVEEALAALEAADSAQGADMAALEAAIAKRVAIVADRLVLAAFDPAQGAVCYLQEPGRRGLFNYTAGAAPADPSQGLYIASSFGGYWARDWDGVHARAEWFGAKRGDSSVDNAPPITASFALAPITQLMAGDYWTKSTVILNVSFRSLIGVDSDIDHNEGTRLVLTGPAAARGDSVMHVGLLAEPASVYGAVQGVHVDNIGLLRDYGTFRPPPPVNPKIVDCDKAFVALYLFNCRFRRLKCQGSRIGFFMFGCVATDIADCEYNGHNGDSTSPPHDYRVGYMLGGDRRVFGFAGANASLRAVRNTAVVGPGILPTGMLLWGYATDQFIDDFETAQIAFGLVIDGTDLSGDNSNLAMRGAVIGDPTAQTDVRIHRATIDAHSAGGILILNTNAHGLIELQDPYCTPLGDGSGIQLYQALGQVSVIGGQIAASGTSWGLKAESVARLFVSGLKIRDLLHPVFLANCLQSQIDAQVNNTNYNADGPGFVLTAACSRCAIKGSLSGSPNRFSMGVEASNTVEFCSFDTTAFNPGAFIAVDAAYKVRWNGTSDARSDPAFAAAHNVLLGVTG